jgi:uncharacterized repeat protein (TIGR03803 family)
MRLLKYRFLQVTAAITAIALLGPVETAKAETYRVLYSFQGKNYHFYSDGARPQGGLFFNLQEGQLYGTTTEGGTANLGTIFKIGPFGDAYTVIHSFRGTGGADGATPKAGLIAYGSNMYGTTSAGGTENVGAVFRIGPTGNERLLHSFTGVKGPVDGATPEAALVADAAGNLYGTTVAGGYANYGTAFKVTQGGLETVLYGFGGNTASTIGYQPRGGLVFGKDGLLYGPCEKGGGYSLGTIYKMPVTGGAMPFHSFNGPVRTPISALILGKDGGLYGTSPIGGVRGTARTRLEVTSMR